MIAFIRKIMGLEWKPKTELDFACLHESGHAVVSQVARCPVGCVMVQQVGEIKIGVTDYHLPTQLSFVAARAMEIGILHGGKAAESILGQRNSSRGILQDEQDIQKQLSQLRLMGSLDFTEDELLSHCEKRAREIIQANAALVRRLAALLSKQGEVAGKRLQGILSKARTPSSRK